ncbi:MAG: Hpt domain-containing protein [Arenibacterium sp.]
MIDWDRLLELRNEVGAEDFEEVVELFMEEVDTIIEPMRQGQNTLTNLESDLHFLKGCALNLGFTGFSDLCHEGEKQAAAGQGETVSIARVLEVFDQSKACLEAERRTRM